MNSNIKAKTAIDKKLEKITSELEIMNPETLLINADPSIEATQIIEQIQLYYSLIHTESVELVKLF